MRLIHGNGLWLVAGLLGFGVLVYYGINNNAVKTKNQSVNNKVTDVASVVRLPSAVETQPKVVPSVEENAGSPDDANDLLDVGDSTNQEPVNVGIYLDVDAGPENVASTQSLQQRDVGMFLDIEGESSAQTSHGILSQRDVGRFIDVEDEGVDSDIVVSNEQNEVSIGEFIDVDG